MIDEDIHYLIKAINTSFAAVAALGIVRTIPLHPGGLSYWGWGRLRVPQREDLLKAL